MSPEAFIQKVNPFKNKVYRLCLRFLSDTDEAADAVQELYMKLWTMQEKLDHINNLEAFSMTLARNHCLDQLKAARRMTTTLTENVPSDAVDPTRQMEMRETSKIVGFLINQLPELQRTVIHLRDVEQYEFEEIEAITGLKTNAIRVNLSRARKKIREKLLKYQHHEFA
jgi:RNA polymerase sigma factor (sigma-70 family)